MLPFSRQSTTFNVHSKYLPIHQGKEIDNILQTSHILEHLLPLQLHIYIRFLKKKNINAILQIVKATSLKKTKSLNGLPMIFNVSGKAMPGLICCWKTEICRSSLKLKTNSTNMNTLNIKIKKEHAYDVFK